MVQSISPIVRRGGDTHTGRGQLEKKRSIYDRGPQRSQFSSVGPAFKVSDGGKHSTGPDVLYVVIGEYLVLILC